MFDDIVVGAGSGGAVIASRLSQDGHRRVLLVEAGPDYESKAATPKSLLNSLVPARDHDWGFAADMVPGRSWEYARGKVTGGSSAVNACLALRGLPADYDEWAALGNPDWTWEKVAPVFRAIETDVDHDDAHHGRSGPIEVRRHKFDALTPAQAAFYQACKALGFSEAADHNHPDSTGVGTGPWNIDADGNRISTAIAYLEGARGRANLTILADRLVNRVIIEKGRAVGIEVIGEGGREQIRARRVTLAGGSIGTPTILLRSGIGDPGDLGALGIAPQVALSGVGRNLVDHARAGVGWHALPGFAGEGMPYLEVLLRYSAPQSERFNDMQMMLFQTMPQPSLSIRAQLMKPLSTGQVSLTSIDPAVQPYINVNLLSAPEDMRRMVEGIRLVARFVTLPAIAQIGAGRLVLDDGAEMDARAFAGKLDDDAWVSDYAHRVVRHYVHPVGTARMGPTGDPGAVVDQHGRVQGVAGLRIADASIMPTVPSANTNLPVIMMAERIAAWMRAETD